MTIIVNFEVWSLAWIIPQKKHLLYRWVVTADNMLPYFVYSYLSGKRWDWGWLSSFTLQSQGAKITSQEWFPAFWGIFISGVGPNTVSLCLKKCPHQLPNVTWSSVCPAPEWPVCLSRAPGHQCFVFLALPIQHVAQVSACAQPSLAGSPSLQLVKAALCTAEWFLATAGPGPKLVI